MWKVSAALAILALCGCVTTDEVAGFKPSDLNKAASQYDGKRVDVAGWMIIEREEVALWDSQADRDRNRDPSRCVSLLIPRDVAQLLAPLNRSEVSISGMFHESVEDFKPMMFTGLCNVSAVEVHEHEAVSPRSPAK